jgi:tRNA(adenine34) deaminase
MRTALELARTAEQHGEVPVGAVVVKDGQLLAEGWNQPIGSNDPTAHAELVAIRAAAQKIANYRLLDTTLYVTLEPCVMCAGAIVHARIARIVFGAPDPKTGSAGSVFNILNSNRLNHQVELTGGVLQDDCSKLLKSFFESKR